MNCEQVRMEGSARGLFETTRHSLGNTEENQENPYQDI
jgi:hypothetical protein